MLKLVINIVAVIALFKLWETPHSIFWWSILILFVLDWLTGETVKTATAEKSGQSVVRFWIWANMFISLACLALSIISLTMLYYSNDSFPAKIENETRGVAYEKELCKESIMSLIKAHDMQTDEDGNILQPTVKQEQKMKDLIQTGIKHANTIPDSFLDGIHPEFKHQFQNNLVRGWALYLEGLNIQKASMQIAGIQHIQMWEAFREEHIDLLYESIIK